MGILISFQFAFYLGIAAHVQEVVDQWRQLEAAQLVFEQTTGTVQILTLADGSRVLRIEDLATSNGPDLKVWLTDAPVIEGRDGWGVFVDGIWLDLGPLKGNVGSQNYAIPADAQLGQYSSVSIWCDRFNVSFGAAELAPA